MTSVQGFTGMVAQVGLSGRRWRERGDMMDGCHHDLFDVARECQPKILDHLSTKVCACLDVKSFYDDYSEGTVPCNSCDQRCFCPTCKGCRWCGPHPGGKPAGGIDLLAIWEGMGRPEIPLAPGVSISDLNQWLRRDLGINRPPEHVAAVWSFLLPVHLENLAG